MMMLLSRKSLQPDFVRHVTWRQIADCHEEGQVHGIVMNFNNKSNSWTYDGGI
jgi:hypothetical protein